MSNLRKAYQGAAIAAGSADVAQYERTREDRNANRELAKAKATMATNEVKEYAANTPNREQARDNQMQAMQNQMYQMKAQDLQSKTFNSMRQYDMDQDPRHFNNFLNEARNNPLASMWHDYARVDELTDSQESRDLLLKQGNTKEEMEGIFSDLRRNSQYVVATKTDGTKTVMDIDALKKKSGYAAMMAKQEQEAMQRRTSSVERERFAQEMIRTGKAANLQEGYDLWYLSNPEAETTTQYDRFAEKYREQNPDAGEEEVRKAWKASSTFVERMGSRKSAYDSNEMSAAQRREYEATDEFNKSNTMKQKNLHASNKVREALDGLGGGDFLSLDLSIPANKRAARKHILDYEELTGNSIPTADKKAMRGLSKIAMLGKMAAENLEEEHTGIVSSFLDTIGAYTDDDEHLFAKGTAAYNMMNNTVRHSLFGSALTKTEGKFFAAASGDLKQKFGPVIQKLGVQLEATKHEIQSIIDNNDPYLTKYYFGDENFDAEAAVDAIDLRLAEIDRIQGASLKGKVSETLSLKRKPTDLVDAVKEKASAIKKDVMPPGATSASPEAAAELDSVWGDL
jgi:hypothetical protein